MGTPRLSPLTGWVVADLAANLEVAGVVALLAASIGAGVAAFVWARNWRRRIAEESATEEPIETYQHMLDDGLIDSKEYDRILARLRPLSDHPAEPFAPDLPSNHTPDQ